MAAGGGGAGWVSPWVGGQREVPPDVDPRVLCGGRGHGFCISSSSIVIFMFMTSMHGLSTGESVHFEGKEADQGWEMRQPPHLTAPGHPKPPRLAGAPWPGAANFMQGHAAPHPLRLAETWTPPESRSHWEIEQKFAGIQSGSWPPGAPEPAPPTSGLLVISKIELSRPRRRAGGSGPDRSWVIRQIADGGRVGWMRGRAPPSSSLLTPWLHGGSSLASVSPPGKLEFAPPHPEPDVCTLGCFGRRWAASGRCPPSLCPARAWEKPRSSLGPH